MTAKVANKPGAREKDRQRRAFILGRLVDANPAYDELCSAVSEAFPERSSWLGWVWAVRAVRAVLWDELAVTEADESVWLTPLGWAASQDQTAAG